MLFIVVCLIQLSILPLKNFCFLKGKMKFCFYTLIIFALLSVVTNKLFVNVI